jgi:Lysyl oxidase
MGNDRFESLANALAAARTRRSTLGVLAGAAGGGLAGLVALVEAEPGERKRKRQRRRARRRKRAGPARYPDLRTLPPTLAPQDFMFDVEDGDHVLRFTNTVWNAGEGRLELEAATTLGDNGAGTLHQNVYDAPAGGHRVVHRRVDGELIYHPDHEHYHFADFASYRLLQQDGAGIYQPAGPGVKVSFCLTDNDNFMDPTVPPRYRICNSELQGLSVRWGDTYGWHLPEQWVVLPEWPMDGGEYALESIVDPDGLLDEGGGSREENNDGIIYFTVADDGAVNNVRDTP